MEYAKGLTTADGSILIAGASRAGDGCPAMGIRQISVVRLRSDGSVDRGFAGGGALNLDAGSNDSTAVEILPVAADRVVLVTSSGLFKVRPDGSLDPAFGQNGQVPGVFDGLPGSRKITAAALQEDGRIVVISGSLDASPVAARFEADGDLDPTFGGDGQVSLPVPVGHTFSGFGAVGLDGQGRIVISGRYDDTAGAVRLLPSGATDPDYGADGNGFASAEPADTARGSVGPTMYVAGDGSARIYGSGTIALYVSSNYLWELDPDGLPVPGSPRSLGNEGSGVFAETPDGGVVSTAAPERYEPGTFNINKMFPGQPGGFSRELELTPGGSRVTSISYNAADGTLLAGGFVSDDLNGDRFRMAVARVDAQTGEPDPGFGAGGAVLLPENECARGIGPDRAGQAQAWNRCRVQRPAISGAVKFRNPRGRKPWITGSVQLVKPPATPGFMAQRVVIRIPKRLRLTRNARKRIIASANAPQSGAMEVSTTRRMVSVTFAPDLKSFDPRYGTEAPNVRLKVRFSVPRGALKPIPRKLRRKKLRFAVHAAYVPVDFGNPGRQSKWWAGNSRSAAIKVRPLKAR